MEQNTQDSLFDELHISTDSGNYLKETTKWCRFIAIVGFVCLGLLLLVAIAGTSFYARFVPAVGQMAGAVIAFIVIIIVGIFGTLMYFLLRFSNLTRRGIELQDQSLFNEGINALKVYFIIYGVLAILGVLVNLSNLFKIG